MSGGGASGDLLRGARLSARALSVMSAAILFLEAAGDKVPWEKFHARDWILFLFFPAGVVAGTALAWRWERLGGGIAMASLAAFYAGHRLMSLGWPRGLAFATLSAPGFLFLLCGLWSQATNKQRA